MSKVPSLPYTQIVRERGYAKAPRQGAPGNAEERGIVMLGSFTAIYEKGEKFYLGYCPEVPGANGQGATLEECRESLKEAVKLILQDRLEDALRGVPSDAIRETLVVQ